MKTNIVASYSVRLDVADRNRLVALAQMTCRKPADVVRALIRTEHRRLTSERGEGDDDTS